MSTNCFIHSFSSFYEHHSHCGFKPVECVINIPSSKNVSLGRILYVDYVLCGQFDISL